MTAPRQILPGTSYLVTRRCSERRFFLRPSARTNEIFLFVLGVAARRYKVVVHAFCVMSNHYHLLVTDPTAQLPRFMQYLDAFVARATNAALGRCEGFWAGPVTYSAVAHGSTTDLARKAAYILVNPVAAGLVERGREWPGLWTAPEQLGVAKLQATRPAVFFAPDGDTPERVELELPTPPGFASAEEFQARVAEAVQELEDEARRGKDRGAFLGRARVLAQRPSARPASRAEHRKLNPRIAAIDPVERIAALQRLKSFLARYREALRLMREGEAGVIFPLGTYQLRVEHGVPCADFA